MSQTNKQKKKQQQQWSEEAHKFTKLMQECKITQCNTIQLILRSTNQTAWDRVSKTKALLYRLQGDHDFATNKERQIDRWTDSRPVRSSSFLPPGMPLLPSTPRTEHPKMVHRTRTLTLQLPLFTWCYEQKSQNHNSAVGRVATHQIGHCPIQPSLEHLQG